MSITISLLTLVSCGGGYQSNETLNIADSPPIFSSAEIFSVDENQTDIGLVSASDDDGDTITFSLRGTDSAVMTIDAETGALSFNAPVDYETQWDFAVEVTATTDEASVTQSIAVQINDLNDNPIVLCGSSDSDCSGPWEQSYHPENEPSVYSLRATDLDGNKHLRYAGDSIRLALTLGEPIICADQSVPCAVVFSIEKPDHQYASVASVDNADVAAEIIEFWNENYSNEDGVGQSNWQNIYFVAGTGEWYHTKYLSVTLAADLADIPAEARLLRTEVWSSSELYDNYDPVNYVLNTKLDSASTDSIAIKHNPGTLVYSIYGGDAASFNIRTGNGALTFVAPAPDYETQTSYSTTISATDGIDTVTRDVTFGIVNDPEDDVVLLDEADLDD